MPRNPRLKSGNQKLKDKMLSAEKVLAFIRSEREHFGRLYGHDSSAAKNCRKPLIRLEHEISYGKLDADCPKWCSKCNDTGQIQGECFGGIPTTRDCDCPAGTGAPITIDLKDGNIQEITLDDDCAPIDTTAGTGGSEK